MVLVAMWVLLLGWAWADVPDAPPPSDLVSAKDVKDEIVPDNDNKKREEEEAEREEAERKKRDKLARVIVLQWNGKDTTYEDPILQRNVRSRIARPDAMFFPDVDLYQNGRKVKDRTVVPAMQPAIVPEQNLARVMDAVESLAGVPERSMRPEMWGGKARELREMIELLWFVDRVELREPLFQLYAAIGRAAQFWDAGQPPFFESIGEYPVNYYYYLAAVLAYEDPTLMSKLTDDAVRADVAALVTLLKQGAFPTFNLDFELLEESDKFDLEAYTSNYETYVNGLLVEEITENGQYPVFFGRNDIYLKRVNTGHGLSERLEATKLEDKLYFVRDTARKKMGIEFIKQLFRYENVCVPPLDGDILNYLAIYQKIHGNVDVYIAVPKFGNPNRVYIWWWSRENAQLQLVEGSGDTFPVRFALLASGGIMYHDAPQLDVDRTIDESDIKASKKPDPTDIVERVSVTLNPGYIPVNFELRGHFDRLMAAVGVEAGVSVDDEGYEERYWLPGNKEGYVFASGDVTPYETAQGALVIDENGKPSYSANEFQVYNNQAVNRNLYIAHGVVLGRDAALGIGPRLALRVGWTNLPHALQTTLHAGWTIQTPGIEEPFDRVRPILDVDLRGGTSFPFANSIYHGGPGKVTVNPVFGITAGLGITF